MSCTVCGYGFAVVDIDNSDEFEETMDPFVTAKFLKNHREAFGVTEQEKDILKKMDNAKDDDALEEVMMRLVENRYCDDETLEYGLGAVVATVMRRETGIRFKYYGPDSDYCTPPAVVFIPDYPWNTNETEQNLKEEDLCCICQKYMTEIGLDDTPGETELEYTI